MLFLIFFLLHICFLYSGQALDDLDADLFGESLLNKSGGRLPAHHRTETVTSASNSGMPDIPHGNAGSGLKQKPVTSSPVSNSLVDDRSMKDSFLKTGVYL